MSLRRLFERIASGDRIEKEEAQRYLEELGIGKGLFGKVKVKAAVATFMARFDKDPKDGGVSWAELQKHGLALTPKRYLSGSTVDVEKIRAEFQKISKGKDEVGFDELKLFFEQHLPFGLRGNFADALARL